jgi:hypothetical protein
MELPLKINSFSSSNSKLGRKKRMLAQRDQQLYCILYLSPSRSLLGITSGKNTVTLWVRHAATKSLVHGPEVTNQRILAVSARFMLQESYPNQHNNVQNNERLAPVNSYQSIHKSKLWHTVCPRNLWLDLWWAKQRWPQSNLYSWRFSINKNETDF